MRIDQEFGIGNTYAEKGNGVLISAAVVLPKADVDLIALLRLIVPELAIGLIVHRHRDRPLP